MSSLIMPIFTNQTLAALLELDSNPFEIENSAEKVNEIAEINDLQIAKINENVSFLDDDSQFERSELESAVKNVSIEEWDNSKLRKSKVLKCKEVKNVTRFEAITEWRKELKHWGLPEEIVKKYKEKGIESMFQWQVDCLGCDGVLDLGMNLVYSAPTSAGKTLVAEILSIKTVLERRKKVIIILPFVSVVREKMFYFQDIFNSMGVRVEGFMGSHAPPGGFQSVHIAICTIEKANSLINRLLEDGTISELGAIVVDELHLLGDPHRGYILELLLTKIQYVCKKYEEVNIQIIGMSATLPNLPLLSKWLDAALYITEFRPIPLDEYCLLDDIIYDAQMGIVRKLEPSPALTDDNAKLLHLCIETIKEGCSVLIFCPSKNWCENLAQQVANSFWKLGKSDTGYGTTLREQLNSESICETLEQLKNCPVGLDQVMRSAISFGVAFHHAGLTLDERDIIESGFKRNVIRVLIATSTLSSGVNLPARRVIIRSPLFNSKPINILTYKQMIGRAGRMGKDSAGESIIFCNLNERNVARSLMSDALEPIYSCLYSGDRLSRAILEGIASNVVSIEDDIEMFIKSTLLLNQEGDETATLDELKMDTIETLKKFELIRMQVEESGFVRYVASPLGRACLSSSMAPNDGLSLFIELQKARQCLVLETELHLIYLVTPYSVSSMWGDIDWLHFFNLWEALSVAMRRVGELVGVQESFIFRCMRGTTKGSSTDVAKKIHVHKRFYTALALQDLVNEVPLNDVALTFRCSRGMLQSLQQSSATFAGMVTAFCRELGWSNLEILVSQFQDRLHFGIQRELLDLMRLPSLNGLRARALFNAGIETLSELASANACDVENALHSALPFQSEKERDGEEHGETNRRNKLKSIWVTGVCGLTEAEAASMLIKEARTYVQLEIGVTGVVWKNNEAETKLEPMVIAEPIIKYKKTEHSEISVTGVVQKINEAETKLEPLITTELITYEKTEHSEIAVTGEAKTKLEPLRTTEPIITYEKTAHSEIGVTGVVWKNNETETKLEPLLTTEPIIIYHKTEHSTPTQIAKLTDSAKSGEWSPIQNVTNLLQKIKQSTLNNSIKSVASGSPSLFGDSLNLDTQACELLEVMNTSDNKQNRTSLDAAFISTFVDSLKSVDSGNSSREEIASSQDKDYLDMKYFNNTTFSRSKSKIITKRKLQCNLDVEFESPLKICKTELIQSRIVQIPKFGMKLKRNTNGDFAQLNIVEISESNFAHFNDLSLQIYCNSKLSVSLSIKRTDEAKIKIGRSVFKTTKEIIPPMEHNCESNGGTYIEALSLCAGREKCYQFAIQTYSPSNLKVFLTFLRDKLFSDETKEIIIYSSKTLTHLKIGFEIQSFKCKLRDPCVVEWIMDPEASVKSIPELVSFYCQYDIKSFFDIKNKNNDIMSLSNDNSNVSINAWATWFAFEAQYQKLQTLGSPFLKVLEVEMEIVKILVEGAFSGIRVDKERAQTMLNEVKQAQDELEAGAFATVGHRFNFQSSKDVAKALGIYKGKKVSTAKRVLESFENPLAKIVIYWRKLNAILTKCLYPINAKATLSNRIHGVYITHTSTGRISMYEPNLQNVPRNFDIPNCFIPKLTAGSSESCKRFICRDIFPASDGCILISADYCQLELRILAHLSRDETLVGIMRSECDIFRAIAATWQNVAEDKVDDDMRQRAKHLCYGIVYGIGTKSLAEQLEVVESEAVEFMNAFHRVYPSVKVFINKTVSDCQKNGYVETVSGRRRYLEHINNQKISIRGHAERQAVNTTIQGSAADIVKSAMISVSNRLIEKGVTDINMALHLHDELIYEVPKRWKDFFSKLLRNCMEENIKLMVPLPVKIKSGLSWGELT